VLFVNLLAALNFANVFFKIKNVWKIKNVKNVKNVTKITKKRQKTFFFTSMVGAPPINTPCCLSSDSGKKVKVAHT